MKKYLCILILLFCTGFGAIAQTASIITSSSNIRHGVMASLTPTGGLVLSFHQNLMTAADKKAFAAGKFIVYQDITFTATECQKLGIASGKITAGSGPIIIRTVDTAKRKADTSDFQNAICNPGYEFTIKIGGAEHKNDWPNK